MSLDLRTEPSLGAVERLTGDILGGDPDLLRAHDKLSPNAKEVLAQMESPAFQRLIRLADRITGGHATESESEHDDLYNAFPGLMGLSIDLFNMVSRRDEVISVYIARDQAREADEFIYHNPQNFSAEEWDDAKHRLLGGRRT